MSDPKKFLDELKEARKKKQQGRFGEEHESPFLDAAGGIVNDRATDWRLVTTKERGEGRPLYKLMTAAQVVIPIHDEELESLIFTWYPKLQDKDRKEVAKFVKLLVEQQHTIDFTKVQPVAFSDELDTITWNRLPFAKRDLSSVTLDDVPEFKHILSLCDDANALTLWIGSLLDPQSGRAQYLHLHGGGGNGKSTLFSALADVIGDRHVSYARADELTSPHFGTVLEGARLLIFPDENSTSIFSSGRFKEFTGEEYTTVNPKFEKQRRIRLTHKTAVFSNNKVEITNNVADRRRLLSVSMVDDPDTNIGVRWWYQGLRNNGSRILSYCYGVYLDALSANPSVKSYIPQAESVHKEAIHRKYEDIFDVVAESFSITKQDKDVLKKREVHEAITEKLKSYSSTKIMREQITQALAELGVREATLNGIKIYRGITKFKGSANKPAQLTLS